MGYVMRCDFNEPHDIETGERYIELMLETREGMPFKARVFCADHARVDTEDAVQGVLNGKWSAIRAKWREA